MIGKECLDDEVPVRQINSTIFQDDVIQTFTPEAGAQQNPSLNSRLENDPFCLELSISPNYDSDFEIQRSLSISHKDVTNIQLALRGNGSNF